MANIMNKYHEILTPQDLVELTHAGSVEEQVDIAMHIMRHMYSGEDKQQLAYWLIYDPIDVIPETCVSLILSTWNEQHAAAKEYAVVNDVKLDISLSLCCAENGSGDLYVHTMDFTGIKEDLREPEYDPSFFLQQVSEEDMRDLLSILMNSLINVRDS